MMNILETFQVVLLTGVLLRTIECAQLEATRRLIARYDERRAAEPESEEALPEVVPLPPHPLEDPVHVRLRGGALDEQQEVTVGIPDEVPDKGARAYQEGLRVAQALQMRRALGNHRQGRA